MNLIKRLTFDDDVLDVLCAMRWNDDGLLGIITSGQLKRGLYERVNKALAAMGGKWVRARKGHVFKTDPRPSVEGLLDSGTLTVERDGFFETPPEVVSRMLELVPFPSDGMILEPEAGLGAIADKLPDKSRVVCVEKNRQRADVLEGKGYKVHCLDFLTFDPAPVWQVIYMNPPFEELQDIEHVRKAYEVLSDGGTMVSVMSESPFFRKDKKAVEFRAWLDEVGRRYEKLPSDSFKASGTGVQTRLVIIKK